MSRTYRKCIHWFWDVSIAQLSDTYDKQVQNTENYVWWEVRGNETKENFIKRIQKVKATHNYKGSNCLFIVDDNGKAYGKNYDDCSASKYSKKQLNKVRRLMDKKIIRRDIKET